MGFPHCSICVVMAFVAACIGFTRTYMFFILVKNFASIETKLKLKISFM